VLAPESARWSALVARFARRAAQAGFGLVLSPAFEDVEVFRRSSGESSEVVTKEMYEFEDKGGRQIALRPEGTASVVRAFVQHRPQVPFKAWYVAPMFRYERPQKGRFRQHHQLGVETIGTDDPHADVEVIALLAGLYRDLGITRPELRLNSLGDADCAPNYREVLGAYLGSHSEELCDEHRERWSHNPLRVLDCKRLPCRAVSSGAPRLSDHLCEECRAHIASVRAGLESLSIPFRADDFLVRGLDYYSRTAFEFGDGVGGGGRYDGLVSALGGPAVSGVGFGAGIERILLACDEEGVFGDEITSRPLDAYVIDMSDGLEGLKLRHELREAGFYADGDFDGRSLKARMRAADRSGARVALLLGTGEAGSGSVAMRVLRGDGGHSQQEVARGELAGRLGEVVRRS